MDQQEERHESVDWPPLHEGHNEPGPNDQAGEYLAGQQMAGGKANYGLAGNTDRARIPGEVRRYEQPIDIASGSKIPPQVPDDQLTAAERDVDDPRHIARGKPSMSSSEGSS